MRRHYRSRFGKLLLVMVGFALLGTAPAASAEVIINHPGSGPRPMALDLHLGFIHDGVGPSAGLRFGIPIVHNGFVPVINNTVSITFGGDFYWIRLGRDRYAASVGFPITMQWRFLFTDRLSAFGEIGFNLFLHPDLIAGDGWHSYPSSWVIAAIGGRYRISPSVYLVGRLGNPYSSIGFSFAF